MTKNQNIVKRFFLRHQYEEVPGDFGPRLVHGFCQVDIGRMFTIFRVKKKVVSQFTTAELVNHWRALNVKEMEEHGIRITNMVFEKFPIVAQKGDLRIVEAKTLREINEITGSNLKEYDEDTSLLSMRLLYSTEKCVFRGDQYQFRFGDYKYADGSCVTTPGDDVLDLVDTLPNIDRLIFIDFRDFSIEAFVPDVRHITQYVRHRPQLKERAVEILLKYASVYQLILHATELDFNPEIHKRIEAEMTEDCADILISYIIHFKQFDWPAIEPHMKNCHTWNNLKPIFEKRE